MILPSELQFYSYSTKSLSNWMCDLYSQISACWSYLVHLSVCPISFPCIALPFVPNFGVGGVKAYFIIVEPNLTHNIDLLGILVFTLLHIKFYSLRLHCQLLITLSPPPKMPSSFENIVDEFRFPTIDPIVGTPDYESIADIHLKLN